MSAMPPGAPSIRPSLDPAKLLQTTWIIWGALLAGQVAFAAVVLFGMGGRTAAQTGAERPDMMQWIALGMLVVELPIGLLVRSTLWARGTQRGRTAPQAWFAGNLVLWALMEGAAFFGLVVVMLEGTGGVRLATPAAAFVVQILTRPGASSDRLTGES